MITTKQSILIMVIACVCSLLGYLLLKKTCSDRQHEPRVRVAIMLPATHSALDSIAKGFIKTLESQCSLQFQIFNAHNNRSLMKTQAHEIIAQNFDLIFTVGATASFMVKETIKQHHAKIPLVFGAVKDPVGLGLISSENTRNENITGISETRNYEEQLSKLLAIKPATKSILLVYDPHQGGGLQSDRNKLMNLCIAKGLIFKEIVIEHARDIYHKASAVSDGIDVIIVLKDNTVVSGIESLVRICSKRGITLFVSDLDSVDKGAALGYGVHEEEFGVQAAHKAFSILSKKMNAREIPVTSMSTFHLKVNPKTMERQGLILKPNILSAINQGETV